MADKEYGSIVDAVNSTSPIDSGFAITPDDSTDLAHVTRGLYVGTTGNIKMTLFSGDVVTLSNVMAGIVHPFRVKRLWATNTTASNMVGVY